MNKETVDDLLHILDEQLENLNGQANNLREIIVNLKKQIEEEDKKAAH